MEIIEELGCRMSQINFRQRYWIDCFKMSWLKRFWNEVREVMVKESIRDF